jgi:hypothetical protein
MPRNLVAKISVEVIPPVGSLIILKVLNLFFFGSSLLLKAMLQFGVLVLNLFS